MSTISQRAAKANTVSGRQLLWVAPFAGLVAIVVNFVIMLLAQALLGTTLTVDIGGASQSVAAGVAPASLLPAIAAGVLLALLARFTARPWTIFYAVSAVLLLFSLAGPLTLGNPVGEKLVLVLLHVATAAVIVGVFNRLVESKA